ncbi:MAG: RluA family pseudouridine synthase [Clostridia bacterium]|nr:RluA family pseudouridine synthase [Clostridia bacterium]
MREFTIGKNDKEMRLDKFLSKVMPDAGQGLIYKSLRKKRIKVNGKRITDGSLRLCEGDRLEIYCNDNLFLVLDGTKPITPIFDHILMVIYEDEHIIIMNKPSGLPSQAEPGEDSLEAEMRAYLMEKGDYNPKTENTFLPSLCHRIDRNTAGAVIGAKDAESLRILNQKIKDKEIRKFYLCETEGTPMPESGEIIGYLKKDEKRRRMVFSDTKVPGATSCHTRYRVLKPGKIATVEAELLTGRTHQIRAGFSHLGHPLVGDVKYGAQKNGKRTFQRLLAYKLVFDFTTESGCLTYLTGKEIIL